jgi:hypothetical protein
MVSSKFIVRVRGTAAISGLLLLSACGGGDSAGPPLASPAPAAQPLPDRAPAPQPAPEEVTLATTTTELVAGNANNRPNWPDGSGTGAPIDGVTCMSNVQSHTHSLISIYNDGVKLALPASVGLKGCAYEMHTHDRSGVVHVEPNVIRSLTLGQFFAVWGQPLSRTAVAGLAGPVRFYVIDKETLTRFDGNPADITFGPHKEIVIITGTAPAVLPKYLWPTSL